MTENDFKIIECELEIKLPECYKQVILEGKFKKTKRGEVIFDSPQKIIQTNTRLRNKGIHGSESLYHNHLAISYDKENGGAYDFIDVNDETCNVYMANRTISWRYNPENLRTNSRFVTLDKYINLFLPMFSFELEDRADVKTENEKNALILEVWKQAYDIVQANKKNKS